MISWKTPPRGDVLVLAPHQDDETVGCGGALALHKKQGDRISVVFWTDGMRGDPSRRYARRGYRRLRRAEARRAGRILGIDAMTFLDYPDEGLSRVRDLHRVVAELLERLKPRTVYYPAHDDAHPDHRHLAKAFCRARAERRDRSTALQYEVWGLVAPSHLLDITPVWSRKLAAIREYRSQLRYMDYVEEVAKLNVARGLRLRGSSYAEAYAA